MNLSGDLPQGLNHGRDLDWPSALSAYSMTPSSETSPVRVVQETLSKWEELKRLGLESYDPPHGGVLWSEYISETYRCLTTIAPLLDHLPADFTTRVRTTVLAVAVDNLPICSKEERVALVEALSQSAALARSPLQLEGAYRVVENAGDIVIRKVFCTHSLNETFQDELALLTEALLHLQHLLANFEPSQTVEGMLVNSLISFGQVKVRQWEQSSKPEEPEKADELDKTEKPQEPINPLSRAQQKLLQVYCSSLEQLGQLKSFVSRTADSLLFLLEQLDPEGTKLVRDPDSNSLLLMIHRVKKNGKDGFLRIKKCESSNFLSTVSAARADYLLGDSYPYGTASLLADLHVTMRAGALSRAHRSQVHQVLATAAPELMDYPLSTYRDWLVLASTTKFHERIGLAAATQGINRMSKELKNSVGNADVRQMLLECFDAFSRLTHSLPPTISRTPIREAFSSFQSLIAPACTYLNYDGLYRVLQIVVRSSSFYSTLPLSEKTLKEFAPGARAQPSDRLVVLLVSLTHRFSVPRNLNTYWIQNGLALPTYLSGLSDKSITRLLLMRERYLSPQSKPTEGDLNLLQEGLRRSFGDTEGKKDEQLFRRTCLSHAHLGIKPIDQALQMIAEIIQDKQPVASSEQLVNQVNHLLPLLWWVHSTHHDPELVSSGCHWIEGTNILDQVEWKSRDRERWLLMTNPQK